MAAWCTSMGAAGWIVMLGVWGSFVGLTIWGVSRLFPLGPARPDPDRHGLEEPPARVRPDIPQTVPQPVERQDVSGHALR